MELVITCDLFDDRLIFLENTKVSQVVEKDLLIEKTLDKSLQFAVLSERVYINSIKVRPRRAA